MKESSVASAYQKTNYTISGNPESSNLKFGSLKNRLIASAIATLLLAGCQSTPTDGLTGSTRYQTSTQPSDIRNLDKQEIARVRTSLAAQYIRKNELDTAQRQLEKAFAADSRYAPAYDMMGVLLQQEGSRLNLEKADQYFKKAISL
ncbi:hypothetical protein ACS8FD_22125, partial [Psychrobacter sp. 1U2]